MSSALLAVHIIVAFALIVVILIQKSEGGGLGLGSGSMGGLMTVRGTANFLTRLTAILATIFMITSILLAILASPTGNDTSLFKEEIQSQESTPEVPVVPLAQ